MKHYTREELELFRNGQMSVLGRITCASHLRECAKCMKIMDELKEDDKLIVNLRSSVLLYQGLMQEKSLKTN